MAPVPCFFIVGCGRSGTTLLRSMLNHHPDVAIPLESLFIADYLRAKTEQLARLQSLAVREYEVKEWRLDMDSVDLSGVGTPVALVARLHEAYAREHGKRVWGQKTPRLVRHWRHLERAFPNARFIHLVRDPRAVAASMVVSDVHRSTPYHAALRWKRDVAAALEMEQALPDRALRITYEDLVTRPEESLRKICDFLSLPFDESMLSFHEAGHSEYSRYYEGIHSRLAEPPSGASIAKWRERLTYSEVSVVESLCAETMSQAGYEPSGPLRRVIGFERLLWGIRRLARLPGLLLHYQRLRRGYLSSVVRRRLLLGQGGTRL